LPLDGRRKEPSTARMRDRTFAAHAPYMLFLGTIAIALSAGCSAAPHQNSTNNGGNGAGGANGGMGGNGGANGGVAGIDIGGTAGNTGSGGAAQACKVTDDDAQNAPTCTQKAPADSFSPSVQWAWTAPPAQPTAQLIGSFSTPLVGNFTDDNKDGSV